MEDIKNHPILDIPERKKIKFTFDGNSLTAYEGMVISSALFLNKIHIFGHHIKDSSPQGIFCANGQCSQCNVIANGIPVKACMTLLKEGMIIQSLHGLPELPAEDEPVSVGDSDIIRIEVLVIGAGPAGLSAAKVLGENKRDTLLIDDKDALGGKLVLQTHKFFGSQEDVYAGKRGINIAEILGESVQELQNVEIWLNSVCLAVFSDGFIGILKNNEEYVLVKPKYLLIATGAREKMLVFPGNTLPGVYGAGAFQTLVNRDLVKAAEKVFIVGGGNVGLIAGYHAIQAGIEVIGVIETLPQCGGYKVHEDKLRRLGTPIYTKHTIISANGDKQVESITIAQIDDKFKTISGTEKTFACDTILIAVGLNPVDEFFLKAKEYDFKVWVAGDAQEIAEASAAIFTGKIEALKILEDEGLKIVEDLDKLKKFSEVMKEKPPPPVEIDISQKEEGIFPVFYCNQEIPCNPCTSVCPNEQIETVDDLITQLPYFKGDDECIGCGKCVAVCPGLAVVLKDYRKDNKNPLVTFPLELSANKLEKDQKVIVVSNDKELGEFKVHRARILKEFPKTQLITIKLPSKIAKQAVAVKLIKSTYNEPINLYQKSYTDDDTIVCRCERVSVGEIRKWIRSGVRDFNELKALTKVGMGSCGGKTCTPLINRILQEEGISGETVTPGTKRPLFIEVPLGIFANEKEKRRELRVVEYDVIIIGAGSVGVPTALAMAKGGLKTLVIDSLPSVAQADNKHAIGGIRSTHSHIGKSLICQRSIEIFSNWQENYGDDIWWKQGGYTFLAFTEEDMQILNNTVKLQKSYGLNIDFIKAQKIKQLIPGIIDEGLLGGTHSPEDGNASPLLAIHSMFRSSKVFGAEYKFNEKVISVLTKNKRIIGVRTTKGKYKSTYVINAAGAYAKEIGSMVGLDLPVIPDSHEAGITEPVKNFFSTMVVDIRPNIDPKFGDSKNYYFYQNKEGKILFCLTPNPSIKGTDRRETSSFLPQISKRMIQLLPRLKNIKVRRTWRGLYPMTPDGNPIIGKVDEIEGYVNAVGMCGQGFMVGPGLGEILSRLLIDKTTSQDHEILNSLSMEREFLQGETLK